jgi:hypothetical protein
MGTRNAYDQSRFAGAKITEEANLFAMVYPDIRDLSPTLSGFVTDDGTLFFVIGTPETNSPVKGSEMFDRMMQHFGDKVKRIQGEWYGVDLSNPDKRSNIHTVNMLIRDKGMEPEEAAMLNFTGKMAERNGFTEVKILDHDGAPGYYTSIKVEFSKP